MNFFITLSKKLGIHEEWCGSTDYYGNVVMKFIVFYDYKNYQIIFVRSRSLMYGININLCVCPPTNLANELEEFLQFFIKYLIVK